MGLKLVKDIHNGKRAKWSVRDGRSYSLELYVEMDEITEGPRAALLALGLGPASTYRYPLVTSATETDPGAFLQGFETMETDTDGKSFRVRLDYGPWNSAVDGPAQGAGAASWIMAPWMARPIVEWSAENREWAPPYDRDGKPVLNKADDAFDPSVAIDLPTLIAIVNRIEQPPFNKNWITYYQGSINESPWHGWDAESVLCKNIKAAERYDADWGKLYDVTYEFAFRPTVSVDTAGGTKVIRPGWAEVRLNAGLREYYYPSLDERKKRNIEFEEGPVSSPVALNENGTKLAPGEPPVILVFNMRPLADFSYFNFPADLFDDAPTP